MIHRTIHQDVTWLLQLCHLSVARVIKVMLVSSIYRRPNERSECQLSFSRIHMYICNGSICTYVCNGYICTNIHMLSRNTFKFSLYIFLASSNNCNVSLKNTSHVESPIKPNLLYLRRIQYYWHTPHYSSVIFY
jgi:hypothetical protein